MTVYLLSITPPLEHARHYIGFCEPGNEASRLDYHLKGRGSRLIAAAVAAGRKVKMVHTWPGADRNFERWLKNRRDVTRWCPCCRHRQKTCAIPAWSST